MKKELEHFMIGASYGGNQEWFRSFMMRIGGCGAETACDSCLYFALHRGLEGLYPFDASRLTRREYVDFAHMMEKYLWPRMSGIDRLDIYTEGFGKYLADVGENRLSMETLDGAEPAEAAAEAIRGQIDRGFPVPVLLLRHRDKALKDYNWHWFLVNGYEDGPEGLKVKAVTYSAYEWFDFGRLWDTGYERRGGLILYRLKDDAENSEEKGAASGMAAGAPGCEGKE